MKGTSHKITLLSTGMGEGAWFSRGAVTPEKYILFSEGDHFERTD
jgi:hypothetical protein